MNSFGNILTFSGQICSNLIIRTLFLMQQTLPKLQDMAIYITFQCPTCLILALVGSKTPPTPETTLNINAETVSYNLFFNPW